MIGIYKITSPSGKVYIGQSWNIERRFKSYKNKNCKDQPRIYNSLCKYGPQNHCFEIICELKEPVDQINLDNEERFFMDFYRSNGIELMNLKEAGSNGRPSKESIEKGVISRRGYKASPETIKKLKDRIITPEWRNNISKSQIGRKYSEERNAKMRAAISISVDQFSLSGEFIKTWSSRKEASETLHIVASSISECVKNKRKTAGGFIWKYHI